MAPFDLQKAGMLGAKETTSSSLWKRVTSLLSGKNRQMMHNTAHAGLKVLQYNKPVKIKELQNFQEGLFMMGAGIWLNGLLHGCQILLG